jgi:hypothetical protein
MIDSVLIFDGTSYFVEDFNYSLQDGEEVVLKGSYDRCSKEADRLNDICKDKPRNTWEFGFAK